jgi:hypothetical protein
MAACEHRQWTRAGIPHNNYLIMGKASTPRYALLMTIHPGYLLLQSPMDDAMIRERHPPPPQKRTTATALLMQAHLQPQGLAIKIAAMKATQR